MSLLEAQLIPAPPYPTHLLPAGWQDWCVGSAEGAGCPIDYVANPLLSAAGTLIGNSRWASPWGDWREPPVIWEASVGRPSSGKTPGMRPTIKLLQMLQSELNEDWDTRRRGYKRDLAAAKERRTIWEKDVKLAVDGRRAPPDMPADAEDPSNPQRRRLFSTTPTTEKAARLAFDNPRGMVLIRSELAGWLGGMDRYAGREGADRAFWLEAYDGDHWAPDRVKDGEEIVTIDHLLWAIMGGIQPDRIASQLLSGDDDGLAARLIYTWPEPQPPRMPRASADYETAFVSLRRLLALPWQPPQPMLLPFTREAALRLQELRMLTSDLEATALGMFQSWLGKLPGFCVRLANILTHLGWCWSGNALHPDRIEQTAVDQAAEYLESYAVPMAHRVFGETALPQDARDALRLARWLMRQKPPPETLNARELYKMADGPGIADAKRMIAALHDLADSDWLRRSPTEGSARGRKRGDYEVNPKLAAALR
jgi:hypothetical protein